MYLINMQAEFEIVSGLMIFDCVMPRELCKKWEIHFPNTITTTFANTQAEF